MLHELTRLFDQPIVSPPAERRLTQRLLDVWARSARTRFPCWESVRAHDLGNDWGWVFVLDVKTGADHPHFVYLGEKVAKLSDVYLSGQGDWTRSLLDVAADHALAASDRTQADYRDRHLSLCDRRIVLYRTFSAPLSEDGKTVTHVLGAANGRFVTA